MRLRRAWCALLLIASVGAWAGDSPADGVFLHPAGVAELKALLAPAQAALAQAPVVRGRFEQRKFLSGVPAPLRSAGEFTFSRDQGVRWHTIEPFDSELELTRQGIVERDAGGTPMRLSADQQPALRVVADVFLSLFSLDPQLLAENFQTFGAARGEGWTLGLVPKAGVLAGAIGKVTIRGGARVEQVELVDRHGDRTEIVLSES